MQNLSAIFVTQGTLPVMGFEELTVADSPITSLSASVYVKTTNSGSKSESQQSLNRVTATKAFITVEAQPIRVRFDGVDPTSSVGHLFSAGDVIWLVDQVQIRDFRAIRSTGSSATINVTYYGA
jgi:hypothetical protein